MIVSGEELVPLLDKHAPLRGIEIGVGGAHTTEYLLANLKNLTLHTIDPFQEYKDWNGNHLSASELHCCYMNVKEKLSPYEDRWVHYNTFSDAAVNSFENDCFDFIFIDGLHEYDQVLKDCINYWPKIKCGGIFAGHDYDVIPAVKRAVDEFALTVNSCVQYLAKNDVWWWRKN